MRALVLVVLVACGKEPPPAPVAPAPPLVQTGMSGVYGNPPPPEPDDGGPEEVAEASPPRLSAGPDAAPPPRQEHPSCALAREMRARNLMTEYDQYAAMCRSNGGTP